MLQCAHYSTKQELGASQEPGNFNPPLLRLLSFKTQGYQDFLKLSKPCHWMALAEYSQMSTLVLVIFPILFLHHFVLAKLASSGVRLNINLFLPQACDLLFM